MIAFDADVLTEILASNAALVSKAANIPPHEQNVPIIVTEEILRGRLNSIRQAGSREYGSASTCRKPGRHA